MSNPREEQAEIHQGLLVRSNSGPPLAVEPTIRLPNDQRAQNDAAQGAIRLSDFFPKFLIHLRELAVKIL
jgi:hypothetical protein